MYTIGARSAFSSNFCGNDSSIPSSTTLTYEGIINEHYYRGKERETIETVSGDFTHAIVSNPLHNKNEKWIGLGFKSRYDGIGTRKEIDLSIALDISGSMGCCVNGNENSYESSMSRLAGAKQAISEGINQMIQGDSIGVTTFNTVSTVVLPMKSHHEIMGSKDNIGKDIELIKENGGTDLYQGLTGAVDLLKNQSVNGKDKRVIFITDMNNMGDSTQFIERFKAEEIPITILGISDSFDTKITEGVSHIKGCNYYIITEKSDLKRYGIDEYNFIFFPTAYNVSLDVYPSSGRITKCIGSGDKLIEIEQEKTEIIPREEYNNSLISFLLCFKRLKKVIPKPVLATIFSFIQCDKKNICNINTIFPSAIKEIDNGYYVNGGMILLKLEDYNDSGDKEFWLSFRGKYYDNINKKEIIQRYCYQIPKRSNGNNSLVEDYFGNEDIENVIALILYSKILRRIMKIANKEKRNNASIYNKEYLNTKVEADVNSVSLFSSLILKKGAIQGRTKNVILINERRLCRIGKKGGNRTTILLLIKNALSLPEQYKNKNIIK